MTRETLAYNEAVRLRMNAKLVEFQSMLEDLDPDTVVAIGIGLALIAIKQTKAEDPIDLLHDMVDAFSANWRQVEQSKQ